jgi:hypothetical protein
MHILRRLAEDTTLSDDQRTSAVKLVMRNYAAREANALMRNEMLIDLELEIATQRGSPEFWRTVREIIEHLR